MKFSPKDAEKFGWDGLKGFAYSSKKDFENASTAFFEVTESHGRVKSKISDRIYFVVDGKGVFVIDGKEVNVNKHDVIIVPKNTPYDYKARSDKLKLFLVHTPAYDEDGEISL